MSLEQVTEKLLNECDECLNRFNYMREEDRSPDFFGEVKPHVDHYHEVVDEWDKLSKAYIATFKPKHVRTQQIDHAVDMLKQFLVQSFYKETGKKRFVQSIQAVQYTLETLLRAIREEGKHDQS